MREGKGDESEFADDGKAVAQGEDDARDAGVGGHTVVEGLDGQCLMVAGGGIVEKHLAVPKGVVGKDYAAGTEARQDEVEVAIV